MKIPRYAFREYDIRGVADQDLTDEVVHGLGRAFALTLRDSRPTVAVPRVAVGRDGRLSGDRLLAALAAGLCEAGADVISVGVGPTPLLYFAAHHLNTDGAVMITASHDPGPNNGFKLMRGKATFVGVDIQALADRMERDRVVAPPPRPGVVEERDVEQAYIDFMRRCSRLDPAKPVRFVVDAGNGAGGPLGMRALRALGLDPDPLFCDLDTAFPNHDPDPIILKNLVQLRRRVLETGARVGVAWDGDGDRIGVLDKNGEVIWGDRLLILFARDVLREHPGAAMLGEVKCSATLYADIEEHGGRPILWKTGHSLIKNKMRLENALLAGEMSGHMFFADRWPGFDDAIYATVRLIELLQADPEGRSLSQMLSDVPPVFTTPELRVACPDGVKHDVVHRVLVRFRPTHKVVDVDGARIDFGDGAWGLCRASNTDAMLVLRFEARTEARRDEIQREVEEAVAEGIRRATGGVGFST